MLEDCCLDGVEVDHKGLILLIKAADRQWRRRNQSSDPPAAIMVQRDQAAAIMVQRDQGGSYM